MKARNRVRYKVLSGRAASPKQPRTPVVNPAVRWDNEPYHLVDGDRTKPTLNDPESN
jgi:hypothetical protein